MSMTVEAFICHAVSMICFSRGFFDARDYSGEFPSSSSVRDRLFLSFFLSFFFPCRRECAFVLGQIHASATSPSDRGYFIRSFALLVSLSAAAVRAPSASRSFRQTQGPRVHQL